MGPTQASDPWAYAFRMYRNYDGRGSKFGNLSVRAVSSNQSRLAVYAATRGQRGALTMMVINKSASSIRSPIALRHFQAGQRASLYRYSSPHLGRIVQGTSVAVSNGRLVTSYPASSITLLVLPRG